MTEPQTKTALRRTLGINKWTAGLAGAGVLLGAGPLAEASGLSSELGWDLGLGVVLVIGLALMVFSGVLSGVARPQAIDRREALVALVANVGWLAAGIGLLVAPLSITLVGIGLVALLSGVAAVFAAVEAYAIWCTASFGSAGSSTV